MCPHIAAGWSIATRFMGALTHKVIVVFLGGLRITDEMASNLEVIQGKKIKRVSVVVPRLCAVFM